MPSNPLGEVHRTDVLVIGCGGAGCRAAIEAKELGVDVTLVCKGCLGASGCTPHSASEWMAYGVALGIGDPRDSPEEHFKDIVHTGAYVCDQVLARIIAYEAVDRFYDLVKWGVNFLKDERGRWLQVMSDGATYPRACGTGADTGKRIMQALKRRIEELNITVFEDMMIVDLLEHHGVVYGALGIHVGSLEPMIFLAKSTIVATGGIGQLFMHNVYPQGMTGDGYAMALRAGAKLVNMEFMQIGPCVINPVKFDVGGILWRLGPKLYNRDQEEFLRRYLPSGITVEKVYKLKSVTFPFTTRNPSGLIDVACFTEICEGRGTPDNCIYFDLTHVPPNEIEEKAAIPFKFFLEHGIDIRKQPLKIAPAVQHMNGGILINERAETSLIGLYAAGEVAGGQHGADRPGGNSLTDCQVFGARAGKYAAERAKKIAIGSEWREIAERVLASINGMAKLKGPHRISDLKGKLRKLMWYNVTVIRSKNSLIMALDTLHRYRKYANSEIYVDEEDLLSALELRNMVEVAFAIITSALTREESRGGHYRIDRPFRDDTKWVRMVVIQKRGDDLVTSFLVPRMPYLRPRPRRVPVFPST